MSKLYADIIINISHEALDRVFQYQVPLSLLEEIEIGMQVVIPFGIGNREQLGYVVNLTNQASYDESKIKSVLRIEANGIVIESQLIKLAHWMKEQYGSTMIHALRTVMPVKEKMNHLTNRAVCLTASKEIIKEELLKCQKRNYAAKVRLLEALLLAPDGELSYEQVTKKLKITKQTLDGLCSQGMLEVTVSKRYRNPFNLAQTCEPPLPLKKQQQSLYEAFVQDYGAGLRKTYLLYGVTGSGKTEVYMEMIAHVIKERKQAIVLIPEIALTFQTVSRFFSRFGERVSIIHSRLSKGERYDQYERARRGEIDVVIGPRSALFMPFQRLGLIIIDEEHEATYKSENAPKYHARETAIERARMAGASVILGSATPSVESYTKALLGEYVLWELTERATGMPMPHVQVVDLREELRQGNRSMFSQRLRELMEDRLHKKQQIMLFINRRGFANFVSCRSCGHVMKCPHCDVSLTYHSNGWLQCHYCGHQERAPKLCPQCKSRYIATFGTGTQKVEAAVKREFPSARVLRMDMDTTRGKTGHEKILSAFSKEEADILVGTQMIVKGHDFSNVTLVGIIAADLSLHGSDYRASERTFQLLTQAAGRAGRGSLLGEVVIQTYSPEHYSILTAKDQDYKAFYDQEIAYRKILKYPPIYQMLVLFITAGTAQKAKEVSEALYDALLTKDQEKELTIVGPSDAVCSKVNDTYRRVLYIKHLDYSLLVNVKNFLEGYIEYSAIFKDSMVLFDFNPMNTY